ncbi:MAG: oligosaccharide flippase family protein [Actinomycetota bacterium]|nr:oligosaccharide flippase family protein [Actinomycetota bacterium]
MAHDVLRTPQAGAKVIRGGAVRSAGYALGVLLGAATSVFLLRHLGVVDFGRYATVAALLGIVSGITDAGLTAVGARELAVRPPGDERRRLLENLVALRLLITPVGVLGAVAFALLADYGSTLVLGTLLAGLGVLLVNTQATMMMPLSVELRLGTLTGFEVAKQALTLVGVALLVAVRASLLPFFLVQAAVGAAVLALTPRLLGSTVGLRPRLDRETARPLIRQALPLAVALAMNVVYFRVLVILMSLLATATATGYFATSFRVFEVLFGLPTIVLSVALPVLSVAGREDELRLRYGLQRMTEVALAASALLTLVTIILAEAAIRLLAGEEFEGAAPVLRIQALALIGVFLGQTWQLGLIAVGRQASLAVANGAALVLVVALGLVLIPREGATGAAIAAVVAELALALFALVFLARSGRRLVPDFGFAWKTVLAVGIAASATLVPGVSPWLSALLASALFLAAAVVLGALPRELLDALPRARRVP